MNSAADDALPLDEKLREHVENCEHCLEIVSSAEPFQSWVRAIRTGATMTPAESGKALEELIQTAYELSVDRETMRSAEINAGLTWDGNRSDPFNGLLSWLDKPVEPDEIGRIAGYRILNVLGAGGMGLVCAAEDIALKRSLAIKFLSPSLATNVALRLRFLHEAQSVAKIQHDNVVTIHHVSQDDRIPYFTMPRLRGETLGDWLRRSPPLTEDEALQISMQIAAGLHAVHEQGLIHRDIKPDNIWIEAETQRVKILDFGLVQSSEPEHRLTQAGVLLGTPTYMAPEQARGDVVDPRSDLFSLGSVLYRMLGGRDAFEASHATSILLRIVGEDPTPLSQLRDDLHPRTLAIVDALLRKQTEDRPPSAAFVGQLLSEIATERSRESQSLGTQVSHDVTRVSRTFWPHLVTRRRNLTAAAFICGLAIIAMSLAGILMQIKTDSGTLTLEIIDPKFGVELQGEVVRIRHRGTGNVTTIDLRSSDLDVDLPVGDYEVLVITDSGVTFSTDQFKILNDQGVQVKIGWQAASAAAPPSAVTMPSIAESNTPRESSAPRDANAAGESLTEVARWIVDTGGTVSVWNTEGQLIHCKTLEELATHQNQSVVGITLEGDFDDADLGQLVGFGPLGFLRVIGTRVSGDGFAVLANNSIGSIDFVDSQVAMSPKAMASIGQIRLLERLSIRQPGLTTDALRALAALDQLDELTLYGNRLQGDIATVIQSIPSLSTVNLTGNRFDDNSIAGLAQSQTLRTLLLNDNPITDASVPTLIAMSRLEFVDLMNTDITAKGFEMLQTKRANVRVQAE